MADTKISLLPVGAALAGTEAMVVVQAAADVQTTPGAIRTYILTQANSFTAQQSVYDSGSALAITLAGAATGGTVALAATAPAQVASATAGTPLSITASAAIAGSSVAGAAAGGSITLTAGAAARLTSGNANGGNITLTPGAGIGTGTAGNVIVPQASSGVQGTGGIQFGTSSIVNIQGFNNSIYFHGQAQQIALMAVTRGITLTSAAGAGYSWSNNAAAADGTKDTALYRNAAGVVEINNGTVGQWGALKAGTRDAGTTTIVDGLTLGHQSSGTPAAGFGTGLMLNVNSDTTADQNAFRLTAEWVVATHASRTARFKLNVYDTATREVLRGEASGSAPMIGFLGANAAIRQTAGAATAGMVYTATEQTMLQVVYDALRTFGLTT